MRYCIRAFHLCVCWVRYSTYTISYNTYASIHIHTYRNLTNKTVELDAILQNEARTKNILETNYTELQKENNNLYTQVKELQIKCEQVEKVSFRSEAEARNSSEQVRHMCI